jgi:hypothetical protein
VRGDESRLVETLIHELTHATRYVAGQAPFNESFAMFVGLCGAERFFAARGDDARAAAVADRWRDAQTFSTALAEVAARLRNAYEQPIEEPARQRLFAELQGEVAGRAWRTQEYAGFWKRPINNAVIVHDELYADRLPVFAAALGCQGGDLRTTIAAILAGLKEHDDPYVAVAALTHCPVAAGPVPAGDAAASPGGCRGYGSMASRCLMPLRTEMTITATVRATTAANEAAIEAQMAGETAAPRKRAENSAYTGHASSMTTTPMNDMQSTM